MSKLVVLVIFLIVGWFVLSNAFSVMQNEGRFCRAEAKSGSTLSPSLWLSCEQILARNKLYGLNETKEAGKK